MSEIHNNKFKTKKGIIGFVWSFIYAANGLLLMMKHQRNFYIHLLAMAVTTSAAFYYPLSNIERAIIIIMIALVLAAEIFNSSIEDLCNIIDDNYNSNIGQIKDKSAAAVLVLAIASVIIAAIIFIPYFI